jgi:acyl-CoA thioester hydrolase
VRFSEVDAMRVVWHGHYVGFFEEARRAFGRRYDVDYSVMFEHSTPAPLIQLHVDYYAPARMSDVLEVTARLLRSESAKLEFEYKIYRQGEAMLLAAGGSMQVFTNPAGELLLNWPPYMVERLKRWESLWIRPGASPTTPGKSINSTE